MNTSHLHRHYHDSTAERVRTQNDRLRWQNQLSKQVTHKALDEPLLEEDPMHVDARRHTTVTNAGLGWKELLLLAGLGLPALGTAGLAGAGIGITLLQHFTTPTQQSAVASDDDERPDRDTRIIPGLRFGPEKE